MGTTQDLLPSTSACKYATKYESEEAVEIQAA